jgi:hypothetical protein
MGKHLEVDKILFYTCITVLNKSNNPEENVFSITSAANEATDASNAVHMQGTVATSVSIQKRPIQDVFASMLVVCNSLTVGKMFPSTVLCCLWRHLKRHLTLASESRDRKRKAILKP